MSDSRERMVRSATMLLREHGATATTIDRVLAHSGAPRGSVYHHFPGGRTQLIDEAVRYAGDYMAGLLETAARAPDPVASIDGFFALWRDRLVDSDFRAGCPVVAVSVEADPGEVAGTVFDRWTSVLASLLLRHGLPESRARRLASFVVASAEGAVVMCRASRSTEPLEAAAAEIHDLLASVVRSEP